ncbi:uncharacterized protein EV154DRAFT_553124 [Mucor mucedo]|uniref:uncharacterized protein n=1 Tax=Mucor mucedo TaxID=29922 RepID=UPI00221F99DC|nr:uncharacterized protein EV154DRAFT_553124 [Mucor mucedo]KAI7889357.1 hypothetical protein EV154DRAFT_553124 [Mucor mucedo]
MVYTTLSIFYDRKVLSSEFGIIFCSPEMTKYNLPFDKHPIITDATYKAASSSYYLVSSVIYVEEMKKYMVFFQAVIKHQTAEQFAFYFKRYLRTDQRGFQQACEKHFNMDDKSSFSLITGCYFHCPKNYQNPENCSCRRFLIAVAGCNGGWMTMFDLLFSTTIRIWCDV